VSRIFHLAHGWKLHVSEEISLSIVHDFLRPAVRAVTSGMALQIGFCRINLAPVIDGEGVASQWIADERELTISIATDGREAHDLGMELLLCLGQALWEKLTSEQSAAYWRLLDAEILEGVAGEIDEYALKEKRALLRGRMSARSARRLDRYGQASFAGTAAEYIHSLWHDVEVTSGPDHLPVRDLRRRLDLLVKWFPPGRGYRLYPAPKAGGGV